MKSDAGSSGSYTNNLTSYPYLGALVRGSRLLHKTSGRSSVALIFAANSNEDRLLWEWIYPGFWYVPTRIMHTPSSMY
jgi:hypothetical protein